MPCRADTIGPVTRRGAIFPGWRRSVPECSYLAWSSQPRELSAHHRITRRGASRPTSRRGVGDAVGRGVRVQSAATAAGRADRRPLLPGGCVAVGPADAAAGAGGVAHRQPRGAVSHPRRHRHRDGRVRRRPRGHHAHPGVGVRLPTPDPVRRRALQAVGAGTVPADARGRAVRPAGDGRAGLGPARHC